MFKAVVSCRLFTTFCVCLSALFDVCINNVHATRFLLYKYVLKWKWSILLLDEFEENNSFEHFNWQMSGQ
jgi:hypothetical protein